MNIISDSIARPSHNLDTVEIEDGAETHLGARVLIVDDEELVRAVLKHMLENDGMRCEVAADGQEAWDRIRQDAPDLLITDIHMPRMDGYELCCKVRSTPDIFLLPILMLTAPMSTEERVQCFDSGANEYLNKPFRHQEFIARVRSMLRYAYFRKQLENAEGVIFTLARVVEAKDAYTAGHIERVSTLAASIGRILSFNESECNVLARGGILHDIGKIGIPDLILNKPGKLSEAEFDQIKLHPETGEHICSKLKTLHPVLDIIRHHHERLDGSGYPDGLAGNEITIRARIMAVCDVYDALTSTRSYRLLMPHTKALDILRDGVKQGHWDPEIVGCLPTAIAQCREMRAGNEAAV